MDRPAFTVEMGFGSTMFDGSPSWEDVSVFLISLDITRGRSSLTSRFDVGTAILTLQNIDGRFTPDNTAGVYYPHVRLGVPVRITATWGEETYPLFYGSTRGLPVLFPAGIDYSYVQVPLVDGFYNLMLEDLAGESYPLQSTGDRIAAVLDDVGWSAGLRDLDAGLATVQATSFAFPADGGEQPALNHLQDVAESEAGSLFMSAAGEVAFRNRLALAGADPSLTFDDASYSEISFAYDDSTLYNDIRVAREDGGQVRFVDAASVAGHGRRVLTRDVMPMGTDSEARNVAEWLSALFGSQRLRITGVKFRPLGDSQLMADLLGVELRTTATIQMTPPGGDQIDQDCAVEQVRHDIRPGDWTTTLTVVPLAAVERGPFFQLDVSELDGTDFIA